MNTRKHVILDRPVLGYILLMLFSQGVEQVGTVIDQVIARVLPGYGYEINMLGNKVYQATGIGCAIGALAAVAIFAWWFRPEFRGVLKKEYLKEGFLMLLPFLLFHWAGSVVSWITAGTLGAMGIFIAFLRAFAPGFGEEIAFRGLGVANYMRVIKSESQIKNIFWASSIIFGLVHGLNVFAGADPFSTVIQVVYAIGIGMLFGAVYLRTANLWPIMIGHMSVDFMEFVRADLGGSAGVMLGMGIGDWVTIAAGAFAAFWGLRLAAPKYYSEIMEVWARTWSKEPAEN